MTDPLGAPVADAPSRKDEIRYRISPDGMIMEVEGAWDRFATENAAPDLVNAAPIDTPFLDHVTGAAVQMLLRSLSEKCRDAGRPLEFSYRCDGPACRRFMRLRLEPESDGSLLFRSWTERTEPRDPVILLQADAPRSDEILTVCAWCKRARVDEEWVELEEAVDRLGLFENALVPKISHDICPRCADEVLG